MRNSNFAAITTQANTGTIYSQVIDASQILSGSIQAIFTDSGAGGTLTLQGSNDVSPPSDSNGYPAPVNWDTVKNGSISATATVSSGALTTIGLQWLNYRWLRVKWVQNAGAGNITVNANLQGN